jgi:hypothetical protein
MLGSEAAPRSAAFDCCSVCAQLRDGCASASGTCVGKELDGRTLGVAMAPTVADDFNLSCFVICSNKVVAFFGFVADVEVALPRIALGTVATAPRPCCLLD